MDRGGVRIGQPCITIAPASVTRQRKKRRRPIARSRSNGAPVHTFAKEAFWCSLTAAIFVLGIGAYVAWSFHAHGYAHLYMSVLLIALLMIIVAAMFVNLWWSRRRKRQQASRPRRRHH